MVRVCQSFLAPTESPLPLASLSHQAPSPRPAFQRRTSVSGGALCKPCLSRQPLQVRTLLDFWWRCIHLCLQPLSPVPVLPTCFGVLTHALCLWLCCAACLCLFTDLTKDSGTVSKKSDTDPTLYEVPPLEKSASVPAAVGRDGDKASGAGSDTQLVSRPTVGHTERGRLWRQAAMRYHEKVSGAWATVVAAATAANHSTGADAGASGDTTDALASSTSSLGHGRPPSGSRSRRVSSAVTNMDVSGVGMSTGGGTAAAAAAASATAAAGATATAADHLDEQRTVENLKEAYISDLRDLVRGLIPLGLSRIAALLFG
jgi:hypothetical protein